MIERELLDHLARVYREGQRGPDASPRYLGGRRDLRLVSRPAAHLVVPHGHPHVAQDLIERGLVSAPEHQLGQQESQQLLARLIGPGGRDELVGVFDEVGSILHRIGNDQPLIVIGLRVLGDRRVHREDLAPDIRP